MAYRRKSSTRRRSAARSSYRPAARRSYGRRSSTRRASVRQPRQQVVRLVIEHTGLGGSGVTELQQPGTAAPKRARF